MLTDRMDSWLNAQPEQFRGCGNGSCRVVYACAAGKDADHAIDLVHRQTTIRHKLEDTRHRESEQTTASGACALLTTSRRIRGR